MKKTIFSCALYFLTIGITLSQQDADGCKDHPMFPTRMPNYFITECTKNFDAVEFWISPDAAKSVTKEGNKSTVRYDFNVESNQPKPSVLQILRNYENAAKKIGGVTQYFNSNSATSVFKIIKSGKEASWVKVETGGDGSNDFIILTIVELEAMKQEVTANDILTALNTDGHITLYINFETAQSTIKAESMPIVEQVTKMLLTNPSLMINIDGHTDNTGTPVANQTLSEGRANAVVAALIENGIDKNRATARGFGQTKPIANNSTPEGRTENRRVEIVKR